MPACTTCNVCDRPAILSDTTEKQSVPCNVRAFREGVFTVWRCSNCQSLHSADDADLNHYYSDYPAHRMHATQLNLITRIGCRFRLRLLMNQGITRSQRILDYGCGGGLFVRFLQEEGFSNAKGYDPFVPMHADQNTLQKKYDAVVSWDVIEHVDEPRDYFQSMVRLLSPGGLLIVGTPNANQIFLDGGPAIPELHQPYHRHILSESALVQLGQAHHLKVTHVLHRHYLDSVWPFINTRFISDYSVKTGGYIDILGEPLRLDVLLTSPSLWFKAFMGYFFHNKANMIVSFRSSEIAAA